MPVTYIAALEEQLEDDIVLAMVSLTPAYEVTYFADIDSDYKQPFVKARISVMVHSGKSGELLDMDMALSEETVYVQVSLEARSRRGQGGIYDLKRQVIALVNGLKLPNWNRLTYADFKYHERTVNTSVWVYNLLFTTNQVNMQTFDDNYPDMSLMIGG